MGPVDFIPTLDLGIKNNSNIYSSNTNEQSSVIYEVRPELLFKAQDQLDTYEATIFIDNGTYADSGAGDDDYTDFGLLSKGHWEFNAKNKLDVNLDVRKLHDDRGSEFTAGNPFSIAEPDEYKDFTLGGLYQFGLEEHMYFTIGASTYDKQYTNHKPTAELRNYTSNEFTLTGYYAVMQKTSIFIDVNFADFDYENAPLLNSDETRAYFGVKWDMNAFFTGRAKFGYASKSFDAAGLDKASMPVWNIGLDYKPTEVDTLTFDSGSQFRETEGSGAAVESMTYSASWNHKWLDRLSSLAMLSYSDDDHGEPAPGQPRREDTLKTAKVGATYNFRRWMDVGLSYKYTDRESNITGVSFDQNIVQLDFAFSL